MESARKIPRPFQLKTRSSSTPSSEVGKEAGKELGRRLPWTQGELSLELRLNSPNIKLKISSLEMHPVKPDIILVDNNEGDQLLLVNQDGASLLFNPNLLIDQRFEKSLQMLRQDFFRDVCFFCEGKCSTGYES